MKFRHSETEVSTSQNVPLVIMHRGLGRKEGRGVFEGCLIYAKGFTFLIGGSMLKPTDGYLLKRIKNQSFHQSRIN